MSINLNCCPNFNLGLGSLCSCKDKSETNSPPSSPQPSIPIDRSHFRSVTPTNVLGEPITLVETDQIHFENLLPNHSEYLYLKILKNVTVLFAIGGLMDDLHMVQEDFLGVNICSIVRNSELFGECICPLVTKTLENGTAYQFCFRLNGYERLICCSIYPCSIPGRISSSDCVIRPVVNGFRPSLIDKFVLPLEDSDVKIEKKISIV